MSELWLRSCQRRGFPCSITENWPPGGFLSWYVWFHSPSHASVIEWNRCDPVPAVTPACNWSPVIFNSVEAEFFFFYLFIFSSSWLDFKCACPCASPQKVSFDLSVTNMLDLCASSFISWRTHFIWRSRVFTFHCATINRLMELLFHSLSLRIKLPESVKTCCTLGNRSLITSAFISLLCPPGVCLPANNQTDKP